MRLTIEDMKRIILQERGSVSYNGRVINNIADLPNEAELALGDPEKEAKAKETLLKQAEDIKAQLQMLENSPSVTEAKKVIKEKPAKEVVTAKADQAEV